MAPSPVWLYFRKQQADGKVLCSKCSAVFAKPATSTLYYHLSKLHHIHLQKLPPSGGRKSSNGNNEAAAEIISVDDPSEVREVNENVSVEGVTSSSTSSRRTEGPLDRLVNNALSFSGGGERDKSVTDSLLYMIARDNMPLSTTEREGFRTFVKKLQPLYSVPAEKTVTRKLQEKYEDLKRKVGGKLAVVDALSLTADIWTHSHTMQSYLGLTAHYREGIQIVSIEIGARPMSIRKTTANLRQALREICQDWQIDYSKVRAVITDGGANIKAAVKEEFGAEKHIGCLAHMLNGLGQAALDKAEATPASEQDDVQGATEVPDDEDEAADLMDDPSEEVPQDGGNALITSPRQLLQKVKNIVRFFRSSDVATAELKSLQMEMGKPSHQCLKLIQEVRTRWNSSYYMLDRYLELSDLVSRALLKVQREKSTRNKPPCILSGEELEVLTEMRDLLKPLEEVTKNVCKEKAVTLGNCIPLVLGLKHDISNFSPATPLGFNLKQKLQTEIATRFSNIELVRSYAAATILDPRYKKYVFESPRAVANIISHLSGLVAAKVAASVRAQDLALQTQTATPEAGPPSGIWAVVDQAIRRNSAGALDQEATTNLPSQLRAYLSNPPVDRSSNPNPLETWASMRCGLEHVYDIAMEYLPLMATSVASERLFSHAGLIANQLRNRLSPANLNKLVFLRSVDKQVWFS